MGLPVANVRFLLVLIFVRLACRAKAIGPTSGLGLGAVPREQQISAAVHGACSYVSLVALYTFHCIIPAHFVNGHGIVGGIVLLFFTVSIVTFPPLFQYFNVHPLEPRTDLGCG